MNFSPLEEESRFKHCWSSDNGYIDNARIRLNNSFSGHWNFHCASVCFWFFFSFQMQNAQSALLRKGMRTQEIWFNMAAQSSFFVFIRNLGRQFSSQGGQVSIGCKAAGVFWSPSMGEAALHYINLFFSFIPYTNLFSLRVQCHCACLSTEFPLDNFYIFTWCRVVVYQSWYNKVRYWSSDGYSHVFVITGLKKTFSIPLAKALRCFEVILRYTNEPFFILTVPTVTNSPSSFANICIRKVAGRPGIALSLSLHK